MALHIYALGIVTIQVYSNMVMYITRKIRKNLVLFGGEYSMDKYGGLQMDDAYKDYDISQVHIHIRFGSYYGYLDNIRILVRYTYIYDMGDIMVLDNILSEKEDME